MQSAVYSHRSRLIPCITMKQTDPGMVYTPFRDPFCISVENRPFAPCFIPSPFLLSVLASPLQRQQSHTGCQQDALCRNHGRRQNKRGIQ